MTGRIIRGARLQPRVLRDAWATETVYLAPGSGATAVSVRVYRLRPDGGPGPYHLHTGSESVYYVLAGEMAVRLGNEEHTLGPGDMAFMAPGTPHSVANAGPEECTMLELYAPGDADFVRLPDAPSD
jgi:mannose-6-phosphate isomerase-like protein (cupin superfamily)